MVNVVIGILSYLENTKAVTLVVAVIVVQERERDQSFLEFC